MMKEFVFYKKKINGVRLVTIISFFYQLMVKLDLLINKSLTVDKKEKLLRLRTPDKEKKIKK